jgi:hypothetical protein
LEQCGQPLPAALLSTPQVLIRPESRDASDSTMGMSKTHTSIRRIPMATRVYRAAPAMG